MVTNVSISTITEPNQHVVKSFSEFGLFIIFQKLMLLVKRLLEFMDHIILFG
ncbi:hypothetical protein HanIR_Chr08g0363421 [Helianthus annuus]|nr:hypothetical protein HanIR_Chr08g0363421 [Helianthus annuus]